MLVERLQAADREAFNTFCRKHRPRIDESFLREEDLIGFVPDEENPTFIIKRAGNIIAAASLIMDDYHRRGRSGRFRIFYSEDNDPNIYAGLLSETIQHTKT